MEYLHKEETEKQDLIRGHRLLPEEILNSFPAIGTTSEKQADEVKVIAKYFHPLFSWRWYASEFCKTDGLFFGFVRGFEGEFGYFTLEELNGMINIPNLHGLPIERDEHFQ